MCKSMSFNIPLLIEQSYGLSFKKKVCAYTEGGKFRYIYILHVMKFKEFKLGGFSVIICYEISTGTNYFCF